MSESRGVWYLVYGQLLLVFLFLVSVMLTSGCREPMNIVGPGDVGGYEEVTLDLPFEQGYQSLCTQGAHGGYSHDSESTEYDLDLDTPNGQQDLVFAPIGGVAYVHEESGSRNFGYHLNIDRGDGTYVVVAHLSEIFVPDGLEVAAGQLIGYEGCTGSCSGDHVHIGLHDGDASQMAEFGESVAVSYFVDNVTAGDLGETVGSEEFVCGTGGGGNVYSSRLATTTWHPNGSLIMTPDAASVYLIEDGTRRWIESQDVFWSLGYSFDDVALVSETELNCYDVGLTISEEGYVAAATDEDGQIWLAVGVEDDPERYRVKVKSLGGDEVLRSWGLAGEESAMAAGSLAAEAVLDDYPARSGYASFRDGTLVKEESRSDVYAVSDGVAMPIETYDVLLRLSWGSRPIVTAPDGVVSAVQGAVGSCSTGYWCIGSAAIESCATEGSVDFGAGGVEGDGDTGNESSVLEEEIDDTGSQYPEETPPESTDTVDTGSGDTGSGDTGGGTDSGTETDTSTETETADTGEAESGDPSTDSGSDDGLVEICYQPGEAMSSGELYLDGGFFTYWDSSPADSASSGDTAMCREVRAVVGEEIKMNAWFLPAGGSSVEWAAYNNWCASIDWQGAITVDGSAVAVETRPWSDAAWASDPCLTGGDAYFNIP